jgi:ubiquinone biosynthesis protein COQ9
MIRTPEMDTLRDRILDAALPNVPFDGWSRKTLVQGAVTAGLAPEDFDIAFPRGVRGAVEHWLRRADDALVTALDDADLGAMRIRDRITFSVRTRLEQAAPHREAVRRALAFLALPGNGRIATGSLYRTVDAIWWACGDRSTDFNFYSKRGLLAAVYASTLLYWLDDNSDDHADTWAFLDRRIADVMRVPRLTGQLRALGARLPNPLRFMRAYQASRNAAGG